MSQVIARKHLTLAEAADSLGCNERTLRRYVAAGRLPAYRVGPRSIRVLREDIEALAQPIPTVGGDNA